VAIRIIASRQGAQLTIVTPDLMPDEQGKSQWKNVPRVFRFPRPDIGANINEVIDSQSLTAWRRQGFDIADQLPALWFRQPRPYGHPSPHYTIREHPE